ncbi:phosphatidylcholine-sterol acyltransferase, putative (PL) [Plasmodium ovale wallikeri]|uniref:Phosphatidylcholine-sterol acyltransferase, putative (PL) n=1 Tax=Plasmodium ovale wallikeri TaxID=864142 RepID=A0A1A8Z133_PLAOA|nr:phosphatidylcholine-sterol acyltransferase, putative (PL) [Plasmodium ovale wallikeri]
MSIVFFFVLLCNLFFFVFVLSFTPSIEDVANVFLRAPYKISFIKPEKKGEVFNVHEGDGNFSDTEKNKDASKETSKETSKKEVTVLDGEDQPQEGDLAATAAATATNAPAEETEAETETDTETEAQFAVQEEAEVREEVTPHGETAAHNGFESDNVEIGSSGEIDVREELVIGGGMQESQLEEEENLEERSRDQISKREKKYALFWSTKDSSKINDNIGNVVEEWEKTNIEMRKLTTYLFPGIGGSSLIAQYKNARIESCGKNILNSGPFRIWISLTRLFSITSNIYCTFDTLKLMYDGETNVYYNRPGVNINVENFGYLRGVEFLDYINSRPIGLTRYFHVIASHYISNGYVDGKSIMGAPYDWRYPLNQQNYNMVKSHIEYMYEKRNGVKVNLIGHSLGGIFINYFLTRIVDNEWKKKYLNAIIYMSTPFKGSVKTIRALLNGNRDFVSFKISNIIRLSLSEGMMKAIGNSVGSLFDLIPYEEYYDHDQIVILINMDTTPINEKHMQSLITMCGIYNKECYLNRTDVHLKVYTLSNWHELLPNDLKEKFYKYKPYRSRHFSMDHGSRLFITVGGMVLFPLTAWHLATAFITHGNRSIFTITATSEFCTTLSSPDTYTNCRRFHHDANKRRGILGNSAKLGNDKKVPPSPQRPAEWYNINGNTMNKFEKNGKYAGRNQQRKYRRKKCAQCTECILLGG